MRRILSAAGATPPTWTRTCPAGWCLVLLSVLVSATETAPAASNDRTPERLVLHDFCDADVPLLVETETRDLSFTDSSALQHLGSGWRGRWRNVARFSEMVWATSLEADVFATIIEPQDRTLTLRLAQYAVAPERLAPQRVDVAWNGTPVGTCAFAHDDGWTPREFSFSVPETLQVRGENRITFFSRYAAGAHQLDAGEDTQPYAFGLGTLSVRDAGAESAAADTDKPMLECENDAIFQRAGSIVRIPIRVPAPAPSLFRIEQIKTLEKARATLQLRWDSMDGVEEQVLVDSAQAPDFPLEVDLTPHAGSFVEFAFTVHASKETDGAVAWVGPRVLISENNEMQTVETELPESDPPPADNVILIVLDALRADALGCYGYSRPTSPHIDAIAENGVVYRRAYASAPYTYSSTWSLLTSLHPFQHGSPLTPHRPGRDAVTLARTLRGAGIVSGMVAANPWFADTRVGDDFDEFIGAFEKVFGDGTLERQPEKPTEAAIDFLRRRQSERFFLYVHYMQPHDPYAPPAPFLHHFTVDPVPELVPDAASLLGVCFGERALTHNGLLQLRARYDENILSVDAEVGKLWQALQTLGLDKNTLIILTADHGEAFMEHGLLLHNLTVYEEMTRIPLIVAYGGLESPQHVRSIDRPVSTVDIYPTVCDALGVPAPASIAGTSLWRARGDSRYGVRAYAAARFDDNPVEAYWWERYKLIRDDFGAAVEVFNLAADPTEQNNLAPLRPVLANALEANALAWRRVQSTRKIPPRADVIISETRSEELAALGYLH